MTLASVASLRSAGLDVFVAVKVTALKLIDVLLCLLAVSAQPRRLQPHCCCLGARGAETLALEPRQPDRHHVQLIAQGADQLRSLSRVAFIHHHGIVSPTDQILKLG
jgi:hypothetical protein